MKKAFILIVALALTLAACGGGDETTADLPLDPNADAGSMAGGACLEGEPDCNDTPGGEPQDLPSSGDGDNSITTISVGEASSASGTVMVAGFLVDVAGEAHLCEALAESFPPQCGGASILLSDLGQIDRDELKTEGDVTWTDDHVVVTGTMVDGTLVAESAG